MSVSLVSDFDWSSSSGAAESVRSIADAAASVDATPPLNALMDAIVVSPADRFLR